MSFLLFSLFQRMAAARQQQPPPVTTTITTDKEGNTTTTSTPYSVLGTVANTYLTNKANLVEQYQENKLTTAPLRAVMIVIGLIVTIVIIIVVLKFTSQSGQQFMKMKTGGA